MFATKIERKVDNGMSDLNTTGGLKKKTMKQYSDYVVKSKNFLLFSHFGQRKGMKLNVHICCLGCRSIEGEPTKLFWGSINNLVANKYIYL